ncbi:hypothetical protein OK016_22260 [Vibrio chagasii]|nr:hypothetical protein [Vibrio chagasii]
MGGSHPTDGLVMTLRDGLLLKKRLGHIIFAPAHLAFNFAVEDTLRSMLMLNLVL